MFHERFHERDSLTPVIGWSVGDQMHRLIERKEHQDPNHRTQGRGQSSNQKHQKREDQSNQDDLDHVCKRGQDEIPISATFV